MNDEFEKELDKMRNELKKAENKNNELNKANDKLQDEVDSLWVMMDEMIDKKDIRSDFYIVYGFLPGKPNHPHFSF